MEIMVNKDFWKGKRVLVTGHTGFKGSWLCMVLHYLEAEVSGYAIKPPTNPNLYELCRINGFVDSTIADIRDYGSLYKAIERTSPEIIIHMAAQPLVRLSYSEPVVTYETNVMGTVNLFESVRNSKTKSARVILNITTDKCYENKEWIWAYREDEPLGGYDPYSSSKACSEIVTSAYRNSFFNPAKYSVHQVAVATARAGNVIGGGDWATDRLIPDIVRSIIAKEPVVIRNPQAIRPWQHVLEPISGYLILCEKLFNNGPKYTSSWNFGPESDDAKNVGWIVERICELIPGAQYKIESSSELHEATYLRLDISKAKNFLNWAPKWNIEKALCSITEFVIAYQNKCDLGQLCFKQIEEYKL